MIDLHTHTNYSDGTDDVITLLKNAEKAKVEILSITDHISCKAYEELKNIDIKQYYTGNLVKGCEFFTIIDGQTVELLGYNINTDIVNEKLSKMYKYGLKDGNKWECERALEICKNIGVYIDYDNIKIRYETEFASKIIMDEIVKYPENKKFFDDEAIWGDSYIFYRECICNSKSKFFVDKSIKVAKFTGLLENVFPVFFGPEHRCN